MSNIDEKDVERIAELTAIKVGEKVTEKLSEHITTQIALHTAQCQAGKFAGIKNFASAIGGGCLVALFDWLFR